MNFFGGLIGGMATAATDKWKLDDEEARREKLRQLDSELRIKEQATIDTLREKHDQAKEERATAAKIATEGRAVAAKDAERTKMVGAINEGATGLINAKFADHQVEDQSTWTPGQEAVRSQGMKDQAASLGTRVTAAANAGYITEAGQLDKIGESGNKTLRAYDQMYDSEGKLIAENDAFQKSQDALEAIKARDAGKVPKVDHFDAKQWDAAAKIDKSVVSLPNQMGDKEVENGDLRSAYMQVFNSARTSGEMGPNDAVEHATTTIVKLKNTAKARVDAALEADSKSTLTQEKAIRDILTEAKKAQAAKPRAEKTGSDTQVSSKDQATRDIGAGKILVGEYGSLDKAKAAATELETEVRKATGDGKSILQSHLNRLKAGIAALDVAPKAPGLINQPEVPVARTPPTLDAQGRVIRYPGDDQSALDRAMPSIKETARNVAGFVGDTVKTAAANAPMRYLQEKINRGESLSPVERLQAIRAGLLR